MEKNLHQIWIGHYPMPPKELALTALIRKNLSERNPDWTYKLWTNANLPDMPGKFRDLWKYFEDRKDYAFQADILRVYLLYEYGGLYLDTDFRMLEPDLLNRLELEKLDGWHCGHWGADYTVPNQCCGAARHAPLITHLYNKVGLPETWYGPSWMGDTIHSFYKLPRIIDHDDLQGRLALDNVHYMRYSEFDGKYCRHEASYTWSAENKKRFEDGSYYGRPTQPAKGGIRTGMVVGTYGAVPYVHLQLEAAKRLYPDTPILVHDDASRHYAELEKLCAGYGREICRPHARIDKYASGDFRAFSAGLSWAHAKGLELLIKISRRLIPLENLIVSLEKRRDECPDATFSHACTCSRFGFRTELTGMDVEAWQAALPAIDKLAETSCGLAEAAMHDIARKLHRPGACECNPATRAVPGADSYAIWPFMNTSRCEKCDRYIWHVSHKPADYAAHAVKWGLPYTEKDFVNPNA